eukprot:102258_1
MSVDTTNRTHKKPRRRRTINNAMVNTQDVSIEPGAENINWRRIAKKKLTDRELRMLYKRQQVVDKLITAALVQFIQRNSSTFDFSVCINIYKDKIRPKLINPQSAIMSLCAQSIANLLENWKGYSPISKDIPLFRDYFTASRHWFDSKKVRAMAINFWIPSMQLIREFAMNAAAQLFPNCQDVFRTTFAEYLNVMVLGSVFEGKIKFPNAGIMWLIPATSFKVFLERYNHRLHIDVARESSGNLALRREFVKCIHSKHDELKSAINQYAMPSETPTREPVASGPIRQQNHEFDAEFPTGQDSVYDSGRIRTNMASNYSAPHESPWSQPPMNQMNPTQSISPSYTPYQNYPLQDTNPFGTMITRRMQQNHDYASNPPPMNQWSFDQMNRNQSTLSSFPAHRNYPATYAPNTHFQHTNTGANSNPFGPTRYSSYDAPVPNWSPCAYCCQCCCCRSFRK